MNNFILVNSPASRIEPFLLLHLNSNLRTHSCEFEPFSRYARWLNETKGYANNTIRSYCEHTARFIDYVFEASYTDYCQSSDFTLQDIIYSYQSFLLFGKSSSHPLANELAHRLDKTSKTNQTSISQNIESAIRLFLEVSISNPHLSNPDPLFARLLVNRPQYRARHEVSSIKANSWLAGTIKDSLSSALPKRKGDKLFPKSGRRASTANKRTYQTREFPIELSTRLVSSKRGINSTSYWRDMTLYSLLAATGARTHEALQVRLCDIYVDEFGKDTVRLISPFSRASPGITEEEYKKLSWKGRETDLTFMIEPFAGVFWHNLSQYLDYEYNSSVSHDFLFQKSDGRPFFSSDRSSRDKTFKKYARVAGVEDLRGISPHSLRHMYGTYLLNYLPVPGNKLPGLPPAYVQMLMGHASMSSTDKYAKRDQDLVNSYVKHANQQFMSNGDSSLLTVREDYHRCQIELIKREIERLQIGSAS